MSSKIRESVCDDKSEWLRLVNKGEIVIDGFHCEMITDRTTPPFSPMRFQNYFFHVPLGDSMVSPTFHLEGQNSMISDGGNQEI